MKKKIVFLMLFVFFWFGQPLVLGSTEEQILQRTLQRLNEIYQGQTNWKQIHGSFYPSTGKNCPDNVCWQGSTLSSRNTPGGSNQDLINVLSRYGGAGGCPKDLSVDAGALGGDVRFRCRRQWHDPDHVSCFAYRCQKSSPEECKQLWRLKFDLGEHGKEVFVECFDVNNAEVCFDRFTAMPSGICW